MTCRRIDHYQKELGGVLALRNNDNNVARQVDIMERRIVKAQNQYMDTIARNNQLRTEVNIWRREILFLKKANNSIRADMKRITDSNHGLEQVRAGVTHVGTPRPLAVTDTAVGVGVWTRWARA